MRDTDDYQEPTYCDECTNSYDPERGCDWCKVQDFKPEATTDEVYELLCALNLW